MRLSDLDYEYPPELVATEPARPSRVLCVHEGRPSEISIADLLAKFKAGDVLVVNESKVLPRRVFAGDGSEILFLKNISARTWEVLFPARDRKPGERIALPGGVLARLVKKGLPQTLEADLSPEYFEKHGEVALPPYIQEARGERRNRVSDQEWYQTAWARVPGSVAAPTASLHFSAGDLRALENRGVRVARVILHVGAGTFLPIRSADLDAHEMHSESVEIPNETLDIVRQAKREGRKVWALGTTATRALEAWANDHLTENASGVAGETRLFIRPPYQFQIVDRLLTNFHQPRSTLLSLVAAFADLEQVKRHYAWAIDRKFKLFSYGDLSAWIK
ncbi:MAG TPA: S-adenosylmethionine:tRNA ribosyltransferase-isomerase [Bdellovibrionales bacterium]|nr:S-adenosylmethionine:tRNA ribosyltransferase-isomerase [Bdellovibrionales bacterium]